MAPELLIQTAETVLPALGAWALRTIEAMPEQDKSGAGYRDLIFRPDGSHYWTFPRSNSGERIDLYLWLARQLNDERYADAARHYADAMLHPVWGIYDGPDENCRGHVWYWRDCGAYMTNYTMRVPQGMLAIYDRTGEQKYYDAALAAGEALLRCQRENGIMAEGFIPQQAPPMPEGVERISIPGDWVTDFRINSRIGYAVYPLALLYKRTGDDRYAAALEKLAYALSHIQYENGSFPCDFALQGYEPVNPLVKGHFLGYIMNGCAAALEILPETPHLRQVTTNLAEYLLIHYRRSWGLNYGDIDNVNESEKDGWRSAGADSASGLAKFSNVSGNPVWRETAAKLLLSALLNSVHAPEQPDMHGALPYWTDDLNGRAKPYPGGYFHFWTLAGLAEFL